MKNIHCKKLAFKKPGAVHKARWMSKVLYSLKIWMFQDQFDLNEDLCTGLTDIVLFILLVYFKAWFNAPHSIEAPFNDLEFIRKLKSYESINSRISGITTRKFLNHLWYLNELNIAFSFFDDRVSTEMKEKMIQKLTISISNNQIKGRSGASED